MSEQKTRDALSGLPEIFPVGKDSGNFDYIYPVGKEFERIERINNEIENVLTVSGKGEGVLEVPQNNTVVIDEYSEYHKLIIDGELRVEDVKVRYLEKEQSSTGSVTGDGSIIQDDRVGVEALRELGGPVNTLPKTNETFYQYRARLLSEYAKLTSNGTLPDIINATASVLQTDGLSNIEISDGAGSVIINIDTKLVDSVNLSGDDIISFLENAVIPAGFDVNVVKTGTFTYISETDYNNDNFDSSKGYDGLDSNDSPKDNGGTYSGTI